MAIFNCRSTPDTIFFIADTNTTGSRFYRLKVNN